MQGLLGFRQQTMSGQKSSDARFDIPYVYGAGATYTFTAPASGVYEIAAWGPGGSGNTNVGQRGSQGGFSLKRLKRRKGQIITITPGKGSVGGSLQDTTVVWETGVILIKSGVTAGAAAPAGEASGGDININGDRASGIDGLDGISYGRYIGGKGGTGGGTGQSAHGGTPGAGAGYGASTNSGGDGLVIISRIA